MSMSQQQRQCAQKDPSRQSLFRPKLLPSLSLESYEFTFEFSAGSAIIDLDTGGKQRTAKDKQVR